MVVDDEAASSPPQAAIARAAVANITARRTRVMRGTPVSESEVEA
jgi:hypothetical protein